MFLSSSTPKNLLIVFACVIIGVLFIGREQEGGNAVGKDVQDFLSHKIGSSLSVIGFRNIPVEDVPLTIIQEIKFVAKRLLILTGIAIERKSFAIEFDLQSSQSKEHIYCLFRMHGGDKVLQIIIKTASKEAGSAIRLQELIKKAFPDYDVPIFKAANITALHDKERR